LFFLQLHPHNRSPGSAAAIAGYRFFPGAGRLLAGRLLRSRSK